MEPLDPGICYRALQTRDPRFDGRLFVGVTSTGIYCRPICPARTPKRENCRFFPTAAAAQEAGFRACLRCRPEISPELACWRGTSNTVSRAVAPVILHISYRPPYDWEAMLAYLSARAIDGMEVVQNGIYRRTVVHEGRHGMVAVAHAPDRNALVATIRVPCVRALHAMVTR